jgi:hypothetical protein
MLTSEKSDRAVDHIRYKKLAPALLFVAGVVSSSILPAGADQLRCYGGPGAVDEGFAQCRRVCAAFYSSGSCYKSCRDGGPSVLGGRSCFVEPTEDFSRQLANKSPEPDAFLTRTDHDFLQKRTIQNKPSAQASRSALTQSSSQPAGRATDSAKLTAGAVASGELPVGAGGVALPIGPGGVALPIAPGGVTLPIGPSGVALPERQLGASLPVQPGGVQLQFRPARNALPVGPSGVELPVKPGDIRPPVAASGVPLSVPSVSQGDNRSRGAENPKPASAANRAPGHRYADAPQDANPGTPPQMAFRPAKPRNEHATQSTVSAVEAPSSANRSSVKTKPAPPTCFSADVPEHLKQEVKDIEVHENGCWVVEDFIAASLNLGQLFLKANLTAEFVGCHSGGSLVITNGSPSYPVFVGLPTQPLATRINPQSSETLTGPGKYYSRNDPCDSAQAIRVVYWKAS